MSAGQRLLQLHPADNVAIALEDGLAQGAAIGHKLALQSIAVGESIIKYGQPIGTATAAIQSGEHVHVHNMSAEVADRLVVSAASAGEAIVNSSKQTFGGFVRANGSAGTRNYVGIVSTVNCSATVVRQIVARFSAQDLQRFGNVDGLCPITHSTGCGMPASGAGIELLRRTLGGYIRHPNMGAVLVVGLGCEVNDISSLLQSLNIQESDTLRSMSIQDAGGTRAAIDKAAAIVEELLAIADNAARVAVPVSSISLALQCGGSDSFSGITAN
ncbi:MAG: altronate dehydratase family protein, partial [Gammaproteobacteria bacterium]|nr:altronate dehydratase family protein [Gammaproteobacteria bacterium]